MSRKPFIGLTILIVLGWAISLGLLLTPGDKFMAIYGLAVMPVLLLVVVLFLWLPARTIERTTQTGGGALCPVGSFWVYYPKGQRAAIAAYRFVGQRPSQPMTFELWAWKSEFDRGDPLIQKLKSLPVRTFLDMYLERELREVKSFDELAEFSDFWDEDQ